MSVGPTPAHRFEGDGAERPAIFGVFGPPAGSVCLARRAGQCQKKVGMAYTIMEDCTGCTACVKRCPTDAIKGVRKGLHDIDPDLCIDCGACAPVCSDNAIFNNLGERIEFKKKKSWPFAFVDEINCVGCEKCVDECPFDALEIVEHPVDASFHGICVVNDKRCTGCRICEWACPYDAIFIYPKDDCPDWLKETTLPRPEGRADEVNWRKWSSSQVVGNVVNDD